MSRLTELLRQKADLEQEIAELRKAERAEAVIKVRAIMDKFELTADEVFPGGKGRPKGTPITLKAWARLTGEPLRRISPSYSNLSLSDAAFGVLQSSILSAPGLPNMPENSEDKHS